MVILHARDCPKCASTNLAYDIHTDGLACMDCHWKERALAELPSAPLNEKP